MTAATLRIDDLEMQPHVHGETPDRGLEGLEDAQGAPA